MTFSLAAHNNSIICYYHLHPKSNSPCIYCHLSVCPTSKTYNSKPFYQKPSECKNTNFQWFRDSSGRTQTLKAQQRLGITIISKYQVVGKGSKTFPIRLPQKFPKRSSCRLRKSPRNNSYNNPWGSLPIIPNRLTHFISSHRFNGKKHSNSSMCYLLFPPFGEK
jgi:hypothetical protein